VVVFWRLFLLVERDLIGGNSKQQSVEQLCYSVGTGLVRARCLCAKQSCLYFGTNWVQDLKQLDWRCNVAKMVKKSVDAPEETRFLHKGKIEVVDLGGVKVKR
jgi:hypothetical protein